MTSALSLPKIAVLCGGCSAEKDISILSGKNVHQSLENLGHPSQLVVLDNCNQFNIDNFDVFFNALHGGIGENGVLANYISSKSKLFTGSCASTALTAWNKLIFKQFLQDINIKTPQAFPATIDPYALVYPVIFKPIEGGSSINIHKVLDPESLKSIQKKYMPLLHSFFIEAFIEGVEVTHGAISTHTDYIELPLLEIYPDGDFYDFHSKYTPGATTFKFNENISLTTQQTCHSIAKKLYKYLPCRGASRLDMIIDTNDTPYVLELNTSPGLTLTSDIPAQATEAGISQEKLIKLILKSAECNA